MKALLASLAFLVCSLAFSAQPIGEKDFARIGFDQRLGNRVPLDRSFTEESGHAVPLGALVHKRPVVLALAYYECPNLCTVVLNGMVESLRNLRMEVGKDFDVIVVSIDPSETPSLAREKQRTYIRRYGRSGTDAGWHFLTASPESISALSTAIGFRYVQDPATSQYAHPSGIVVLTPQGVVSRYFLGIEYPPKELSQALSAASTEKVGGLAQQLLLLCFHYDPTTGRYTPIIQRILQLSGTGTVLILGLLVVRLTRKKPAGFPAAAGVFLAFSFAPDRASDIARSVDAIFYSLLALCGLVALGVGIAILFYCVRYRAGSPARRTAKNPPSLPLEITWTTLTLGAFLAIFVWGAVVYFRMARPPSNATEIHVVGKQWMWKVQHPEGQREINEMHLLVNHPVKLVMTSQDVIHDFFVPAFRTKMDVLPGRYTTEWFTPTQPGSYHIFCSEYCGSDHSRMGGWVHVLESEAYARWLASQPSPDSMVTAGQRLFQARGCSGCHSPNATIRAPLLDGIYGKPVALSTGTTKIADDQYLHDSILVSTKDVVAGYQPVMPVFQGQLTEEEVMQLVAYIKSLGERPKGGP